MSLVKTTEEWFYLLMAGWAGLATYGWPVLPAVAEAWLYATGSYILLLFMFALMRGIAIRLRLGAGFGTR